MKNICLSFNIVILTKFLCTENSSRGHLNVIRIQENLKIRSLSKTVLALQLEKHFNNTKQLEDAIQ